MKSQVVSFVFGQRKMWMQLFYGSLSLVGLTYIWLKWKWTFWTKRGVYQVPQSFPLGSYSYIFTQKCHANDHLKKTAEKVPKNLPYYGEYTVQAPVLIIKDVDLARQILVKDFDHFIDRFDSTFERIFKSGTLTDKIWEMQMVNVKGDLWKNIRSTFTPIFTSGKMKAMLIFMQESSNNLVKGFEQKAKMNEEFELKSMTGKFAMDAIASCAFGINAESFTNENSKFVKYAKRIFEIDFITGMKYLLGMMPGGAQLMGKLSISVNYQTETEYFYHVITASLKHRRETKTRRNDLVDMMLDAIKGDLEHEVGQDNDQFEKDAKLNHDSKKAFDELVIVANALVLLVAGYDTSGATLAYICYHLAKNPDIQDHVREEVEEIIEDDPSRNLSYDDLSRMTYIDQVISETLRFHNIAAQLQRVTEKDYKIPGSDLVLPKDTTVVINPLAIHFDPKHYSNPHEFDPDHFSKEAKAKRHPYAFLPFGQGPRGCIGMRFALLEIKLAIANIVRNFTLFPSDKTTEPLELDPVQGVAWVKNGLHIRVEKRD